MLEFSGFLKVMAPAFAALTLTVASLVAATTPVALVQATAVHATAHQVYD